MNKVVEEIAIDTVAYWRSDAFWHFVHVAILITIGRANKTGRRSGGDGRGIRQIEARCLGRCPWSTAAASRWRRPGADSTRLAAGARRWLALLRGLVVAREARELFLGLIDDPEGVEVAVAGAFPASFPAFAAFWSRCVTLDDVLSALVVKYQCDDDAHGRTRQRGRRAGEAA